MPNRGRDRGLKAGGLGPHRPLVTAITTNSLLVIQEEKLITSTSVCEMKPPCKVYSQFTGLIRAIVYLRETIALHLYSNVRKSWHKDDLYVKDIEIVKIYSKEPIDVANPTAKLEKTR